MEEKSPLLPSTKIEINRCNRIYDEGVSSISSIKVETIISSASPRMRQLLTPILQQKLEKEVQEDTLFKEQFNKFNPVSSPTHFMERLKKLILESVESAHQEQCEAFDKQLLLKEKEIEQERLKLRIAVVGVCVSVTSMLAAIIAYYFPQED